MDSPNKKPRTKNAIGLIDLGPLLGLERGKNRLTIDCY
ncbi:MAG: hypothetical protein ACI88H_003572 [Cocleimonas sp.]|jgi:hypothetical protein